MAGVISWHCGECTRDCILVPKLGKCFCNHKLGDHALAPDSNELVCGRPHCGCRRFFFQHSAVPRCQCKHLCAEHSLPGQWNCNKPRCKCVAFSSRYICECGHGWVAHATSAHGVEFFPRNTEVEQYQIDVGTITGESASSASAATSSSLVATSSSSSSAAASSSSSSDGETSFSSSSPVIDLAFARVLDSKHDFIKAIEIWERTISANVGSNEDERKFVGKQMNEEKVAKQTAKNTMGDEDSRFDVNRNLDNTAVLKRKEAEEDRVSVSSTIAAPAAVSSVSSVPTSSFLVLHEENKARVNNNIFQSSASLFAKKDIVVCCRVRPLLNNEPDVNFSVISCPSTQSCNIHVPSFNTFSGKPQLQTNDFELDRVFGPLDTNEEVFEALGAPLVPLAVGGGTATLFAYGQTGSGKTFTVIALLQALVKRVFEQKASHHQCSVSFLELLGEDITCLLSGRRVKLLEDRFSKLNLSGAEDIAVESHETFQQICSNALSSRRTEVTLKNNTSSRSHCVVRVRISTSDPVLKASGRQDGLLFLVDLAGSERAADRKEHNEERMKESKLINVSLMTLKACISARGQAGGDKHVHIPLRSSTLTMILRDAFELAVQRPTKVAVVACLSPLANDASHSLNTARYTCALRMTPVTRVLDTDMNNPFNWSYEEACAWLRKVGKGIQPEDLIQEGQRGSDLAQLPEDEFIMRCVKHKKMSEVVARQIYLLLWKKRGVHKL